ncbi:hypothetical protein KSF78_0007148 [Schistosoma japonicum]|nr:hypothetical protein KSF78_0007148 [Schistosoma japonicum]
MSNICIVKLDCGDDYKEFRRDIKSIDLLMSSKFDCIHLARTFLDDAVMENQGNWFQAIAHYPTNTLVEIANRCRKSRELLIKFDDATPKHASNISTTRIHFISLDLTPITFRIRTEDIQLMVPVVSKVTGRVYDNFNSSVCHGELNSTVPGEELTGFTLTQHHLFNNMVIRKNLRNQSITILKCTILSIMFTIISAVYFVLPALVLNKIYHLDPIKLEMKSDHYVKDTTSSIQVTFSIMANFNPGFCVVWIFQLLVCILPQQTILSHVAALISSGHGTTLEYVSLMNSLMNRFLRNRSSSFVSRRLNSTSTASDYVLSSNLVNMKVISLSGFTLDQLEFIN